MKVEKRKNGNSRSKLDVIKMVDHGNIDAAFFGRLKICSERNTVGGNLPA